MLRWQLSTPILWLVLHKMGAGITATIVANLIGGSIFFWVDKFIFTSKAIELWHYRETGICPRCGKMSCLWRLVKTDNYDKSGSAPIFLCHSCSRDKIKELNAKGIDVKFVPKEKGCQ